MTPPVVSIALLLLLLSLIDALATLRLLRRGCVEANPAMRFLLEQGVHIFLGGKILLTCGGVGFLLQFRYHRFFIPHLRIGHVLIVLTSLYAALNLYQAVLFAIA